MKNQKTIAILFGGISAEHEVSIITGLQVLENINRNLFKPLPILIDKDGSWVLLSEIKHRKDYAKASRTSVSIGKDQSGTFIVTSGMLAKKYYLNAAYLALHGGSGESGPIQGMFESFNLPFTSSGQEASVLSMNKILTKQVLKLNDLPTLPWQDVSSKDINESNLKEIADQLIAKQPLPLIVKPAHLGSSIGINVAHDVVELQQALLKSSMVDSQILIEPYLTKFTEYNCAVRLMGNDIETSEIEKPIGIDAILSFADKYERGSKKQGGGNGMASLSRELPAQISSELKNKLQAAAKAVFKACLCKGMVRIDFMVVSENEFYVTEINPIPGSMAFYLWEASGINFQQQITDLIEQAIYDQQISMSKRLDYQTNIVDKFVQ